MAAVPLSSQPPATVGVKERRELLNFKSGRQEPRDPGACCRPTGKTVPGLGRTILISNNRGKTGRFNFSTGLCRSFSNAGRPRARVLEIEASSSSAPSLSDASCAPPNHPSLAPMQGVGAGTGAGGRSSEPGAAMERAGAGGRHGRGSDGPRLGRGRGSGHSGGEDYYEEEDGYYGGGDFHGTEHGFAPGYGDYYDSGRGRGWPRRGFRPRGTRGFAARRGGRTGRPGRGAAPGRAAAGRHGPALEGRSAPAGREAPKAAPILPSGVDGGHPDPALFAPYAGSRSTELDKAVGEGEVDVARNGGKAKTCSRCSF
ncbi:hypothetical protein SEVIR_6G086085v4 [Setaria viridis]